MREHGSFRGPGYGTTLAEDEIVGDCASARNGDDGLAHKQDIHAGRGDGFQVANGGIMASVLMLSSLAFNAYTYSSEQ